MCATEFLSASGKVLFSIFPPFCSEMSDPKRSCEPIFHSTTSTLNRRTTSRDATTILRGYRCHFFPFFFRPSLLFRCKVGEFLWSLSQPPFLPGLLSLLRSKFYHVNDGPFVSLDSRGETPAPEETGACIFFPVCPHFSSLLSKILPMITPE